MKKIYEKPTVEVVDVELESLLAASIKDAEIDTGESVENSNAESGAGGYSKEHNGFWE